MKTLESFEWGVIDPPRRKERKESEDKKHTITTIQALECLARMGVDATCMSARDMQSALNSRGYPKVKVK